MKRYSIIIKHLNEQKKKKKHTENLNIKKKSKYNIENYSSLVFNPELRHFFQFWDVPKLFSRSEPIIQKSKNFEILKKFNAGYTTHFSLNKALAYLYGYSMMEQIKYSKWRDLGRCLWIAGKTLQWKSFPVGSFRSAGEKIFGTCQNITFPTKIYPHINQSPV